MLYIYNILFEELKITFNSQKNKFLWNFYRKKRYTYN